MLLNQLTTPFDLEDYPDPRDYFDPLEAESESKIKDTILEYLEDEEMNL